MGADLRSFLLLWKQLVQRGVHLQHSEPDPDLLWQDHQDHRQQHLRAGGGKIIQTVPVIVLNSADIERIEASQEGRQHRLEGCEEEPGQQLQRALCHLLMIPSSSSHLL